MLVPRWHLEIFYSASVRKCSTETLNVLTHKARIRGDLTSRIRHDVALDSLQCYCNGPIHTWCVYHCKFAAIFLQCDFLALDPFLSHEFCSVAWFFMLKLVALLFVLPFPCISNVGQIFFLLLELWIQQHCCSILINLVKHSIYIYHCHYEKEIGSSYTASFLKEKIQLIVLGTPYKSNMSGFWWVSHSV